MENFKDVSLLITHYNRPKSLERLLSTFNMLECMFDEIIVSDDGSKSENQIALKDLQLKFNFKLIRSTKNMGLGNNVNKGQKAVTSAMTLYIQEDFVPTAMFPENFRNALNLMETNPDVDIIRLYAYYAYPYLEPYANGFSEMLIKPYYLNYTKIYYYSDHPHLRRSNFLEKFGDYQEGLAGDRTEYRMCLSFIQNNGKGLFYNKFKDLFVQENSEIEPSTMTRTNLTSSNNPFISALRYIYRQLKYNYDINFYRQK
jgi:glycosyltransferase involved in cell wall biosynthesis